MNLLQPSLLPMEYAKYCGVHSCEGIAALEAMSLERKCNRLVPLAGVSSPH